MKLPQTRQREPFIYDGRRRQVRGRFILESGKRERVFKLCAFDHVGITGLGEPEPDRVNGPPIYKSAAAKAEADATLFDLHARKLAELRDEAEGPTGTRPISEAWKEWRDLREPELAAGTIAYYDRTGAEYQKVIGDHPLGGLSVFQVERFRAALLKRGLSPESVNIRLQNLRTFAGWAKERGELAEVPRIKGTQEEKKLPEVLTREQVGEWLCMLKATRRWRKGQPPIMRGKMNIHPNRSHRAGARHREHWIRVAIDTGLRMSEGFYLTLAQFNTDTRTLRVQSHGDFRVKEKRWKEIPLTARICRLIRALRRARPQAVYLLDNGRGSIAYSSPESMGQVLASDMDALGFKGPKIPGQRRRGVKRAHGFRALFAHSLREADVDVYTIKNLMGHQKMATTEGYFPKSEGPERRAIEALERRYNPGKHDKTTTRNKSAKRKPL